MPRFNHSIVHEVADLGLPHPEEVIINHGAALVIRGIRPENPNGDIDFSTSLENILYLREELGWRAVRMIVGTSKDGEERAVVATRDEKDRFDVHRWDFSMKRYNRIGKGRIYLPEQGKLSEQDEETGLWVASIDLVELTKQETGRPQDEADLRRIRQFQDFGY